MTFEWSNFNIEYANPVTAYKGNDLATLNSCSIADFFAGSLDVKPGYLDGLIAFSGVVDTNDSGHTLADYRNVLITGSNLVAKTISTEYTSNPSWKILASSGGLFDSPLFGTKAGTFNVGELSQNVRELGSARDITKLVYAVCVLASIMNSNYMHNNFDAFVSELRTNLEACNGSVDSIYNCCMLALNLVGAPSPDTDEDIVDEDTDEDIIDEDIVDEDIIEEDADEDIIDEDANEGTGTDENEPETPEEEPVVLDDIPSDDIPAWCSERVNIAATNLCGSLQAFLEKCLLNSPYGFPYVNSRGETHLCYFDGNTTSLKQCPINTDYGALANVARATLSNKLASDNSLTAIRANSFIPDSYFDAPYKIMAPSCEKLDSWAPLWLIPFCFGYTTLDGVSWVSTSDIHKLLSGVKFIARAQLKVAALYCLKQNNIALSSIENDIDGEKVRVFLSACVDCWSRMLIIERFDFPKLLSIYYSCNDGGIPGYVSAIAKGLDEFKQQSKIARQLANVTPGGNVTRGIYIARYSYDVNEYMNEVAFGYKAVADLKRVHKNPSMKNVLLGVTMGGEPVSRDLSSNSTFCINVFGASRAGKGVMTLSVLGTAVADGYPFIYYDNKPEMAETLWKLESELGGERILAVDNESINKFLSDSRNPAMPDRLASAIDFGHLTFERSFKPLFSSAAWDSVAEVTITNSDSSDAGQAESKIAVSAEGQIRGYALFLKYVLLSLLISEKNTDKNRCIPVGKKMISVVDELNATYIKFGIEGLSLSNQGRMGGQLALKNGLKGIVQDLKGDRRDFQAKINELRKQIDKAQADINAGKSKDPNALQNKISSARQELQALESQLYAATPAYNRLKRVGDFFGIAMNGTEKDGTYANTLTFTDTCIAASNFFNQKGGSKNDLAFLLIGQDKQKIAGTGGNVFDVGFSKGNLDILGNGNVDNPIVAEQCSRSDKTACLPFIEGTHNKATDDGKYHGYFVVGSGSGLVSFKSYLTLNENDYDENNPGKFTANCPTPGLEGAARTAVFMNGNERIRGIGFAGYIDDIMADESGAVDYARKAETLGSGYRIAQKVLDSVGMFTAHPEYNGIVENWLYDMTPESFYTFDELSRGVKKPEPVVQQSARTPVQQNDFSPAYTEFSPSASSQSVGGGVTTAQLAAMNKVNVALDKVLSFFKDTRFKQSYIQNGEVKGINSAIGVANTAIDNLNVAVPDGSAGSNCDTMRIIEQKVALITKFQQEWKSERA